MYTVDDARLVFIFVNLFIFVYFCINNLCNIIYVKKMYVDNKLKKIFLIHSALIVENAFYRSFPSRLKYLYQMLPDELQNV